MTYPEKYANTRKDRLRGREWLKPSVGERSNKMNERLTRPTPSPSVAESVNRIWTVGSNHFINFSSPKRDSLKASAWAWNNFKMSSGVWHVSSCAEKGCVSRRFPVTFWYSFEAVLNIALKLSVEELGV